MTDFLTFEESEATRQLINLGYVHAAQSFSAVARQPIAIETTHLSISRAVGFLDEHAFQPDRLRVLTTRLIGELPGKSLLVFSESDCQEVYRLCLANHFSSEKSGELEEAILLEIDNILAAAVIAQFANALGVKMYGGVPQLHQTDRAGLVASLMDGNSGSAANYYLFSNARFTLKDNSLLQPQFIWILPEDFLKAIQRKIRAGEKLVR
ncbi:MAG: hypothetical protein H7Z75_04850 [Ferruginibacter sp.]|nr:hypothetical protein [Cytophagales bacterium]